MDHSRHETADRRGPGPLPVALAALDRAGVPHCRLRSPGPGPVREVDVLVQPGDLPRAAQVLGEFGFERIPAWGHAPHHFFVAYEPATGAWAKVDVVTDLLYGRPVRALRGGDARAWLRRRQNGGRPCPADELAGLLLHCLLDRGSFPARHRARIRRLVRELHGTGEAASDAARALDAHLAPALPWEVVRRAVRARDWDALLARRRALARQLFRREPVPTAVRFLAAWGARRLRPLASALLRRGAIVAVIGPDGSGKTTLCDALACEPPLRARRIYFGSNPEASRFRLRSRIAASRERARASGRTVRRLLLKAVGFTARLAELWVRIALVRYHVLRGRVVVCDRHPVVRASTLAAGSVRQRLRRWLLSAGAPAPDLVLVLDAPPEILLNRKQEHPEELMEALRRKHLELARTIPGAVVLDTTTGPDAVRRRAVSLVWDLLRAPSRPAASRETEVARAAA